MPTEVVNRESEVMVAQRTVVSRRETWVGVALALIVATSFALRLPFLGQKSLWLDEMWSIGIARMSWHSIWSAIRNLDPNMSLYYSVLHVWMKLGSGEFTLRLLSVLFGVAGVAALFALGNRLFGRWAGLIASALLAVNAFHIQWSQEARSYSMVVLLVTLSSLFFVKSMEEGGVGNWCGYVAFSVLAVYAHLFGGLVLAAHGASLMFRARREIPWKNLVLSSAAIAILIVPLATLSAQRAHHTAVPFSWVPSPSLHGIYDGFYTIAGNAEFAGSEGGKAILTVYIAACFAAIVWAVRRRKQMPSDLWHIGLLLCWVFVPVALVLLISLRQSMFLNRYFLICVPALALLAAAGIASLRRQYLMVAALMLMVGLSGARLAPYYHFRSQRQEWRSATDHVIARTRPRDTAIFYVAPGRLLFDYYRERYSASSPQLLDISFPQFSDEKNDPDALSYLPPIGEDVIDTAAQHPRVWLILYHDQWSFTTEQAQRLRAQLAADHPDVQERSFEKITVLLYSRPQQESARSLRSTNSALRR